MKNQITKIENVIINREDRSIAEHNKIAKILAMYDGKPIDHRTLSNKRLEGLTLEIKFGMFNIKGEFSHLIGYNSNPFINAEKFKDFDACYNSAAIERVNKIKAIDRDKVNKAYAKIKKHYEGLKAAFGEIEDNNLGSFHYSPHYEILEYIQKDDKSSRNNVKLSDFYYIRKTK